MLIRRTGERGHDMVQLGRVGEEKGLCERRPRAGARRPKTDEHKTRGKGGGYSGESRRSRSKRRGRGKAA